MFCIGAEELAVAALGSWAALGSSSTAVVCLHGTWVDWFNFAVLFAAGSDVRYSTSSARHGGATGAGGTSAAIADLKQRPALSAIEPAARLKADKELHTS